MEQLLTAAVPKLVEYGGTVTVMGFTLIFCGKLIKLLIDRNNAMADKMLLTIEGNTKAMTDLAGEIRNGRNNAKN